MEDQNQTSTPDTNPPGETPPISQSGSSVPPASSGSSAELPAAPAEPVPPETPPAAVTPPEDLPGSPANNMPPPPPMLNGQIPPPNYGYFASAPVQETNLWAIVSLVSSILSWLGLFGIGGIVGVIAGIVARNQIRASDHGQGGDGLALAGIIIGAVNIIIACVAVMCLVLAFSGMVTLPFIFGNGTGR